MHTNVVVFCEDVDLRIRHGVVITMHEAQALLGAPARPREHCRVELPSVPGHADFFPAGTVDFWSASPGEASHWTASSARFLAAVKVAIAEGKEAP